MLCRSWPFAKLLPIHIIISLNRIAAVLSFVTVSPEYGWSCPKLWGSRPCGFSSNSNPLHNSDKNDSIRPAYWNSWSTLLIALSSRFLVILTVTIVVTSNWYFLFFLKKRLFNFNQVSWAGYYRSKTANNVISVRETGKLARVSRFVNLTLK